MLFVGDGWGGMRIINVSDPFHPTELGRYSGNNGPYGWSVRVVDNIAYLSSGFMHGGKPGFLIINISNPLNPVLIKEVPAAYDIPDLEIIESNVLKYVKKSDKTATFVFCTLPDPSEILDKLSPSLLPNTKVLLFEWVLPKN